MPFDTKGYGFWWFPLFWRKILSFRFTHFLRNVFKPEKKNPQTLLLLKCMIPVLVPLLLGAAKSVKLNFMHVNCSFQDILFLHQNLWQISCLPGHHALLPFSWVAARKLTKAEWGQVWQWVDSLASWPQKRGNKIFIQLKSFAKVLFIPKFLCQSFVYTNIKKMYFWDFQNVS